MTDACQVLLIIHLNDTLTQPTVEIAQSNVIINKPTNEGDRPVKGSPVKHLSAAQQKTADY